MYTGLIDVYTSINDIHRFIKYNILADEVAMTDPSCIGETCTMNCFYCPVPMAAMASLLNSRRGWSSLSVLLWLLSLSLMVTMIFLLQLSWFRGWWGHRWQVWTSLASRPSWTKSSPRLSTPTWGNLSSSARAGVGSEQQTQLLPSADVTQNGIHCH